MYCVGGVLKYQAQRHVSVEYYVVFTKLNPVIAYTVYQGLRSSYHLYAKKKMCSFCNQPGCSKGSYLALPSTPGNRLSDLCRNPASRSGPENRMVKLATKISTSAEPIYTQRQHQNIAVGFTFFSSLQFCIVAITK